MLSGAVAPNATLAIVKVEQIAEGQRIARELWERIEAPRRGVNDGLTAGSAGSSPV